MDAEARALLGLATLLALALSNSPLGAAFEACWETPVALALSDVITLPFYFNLGRWVL